MPKRIVLLIVELDDVPDEADVQPRLDAFREAARDSALEYGVTLARATTGDVEKFDLFRVDAEGFIPSLKGEL